ncbi:Bug family tripartite tricarboxylate transporter substrate binding protein [Halomonas llamarensis]|uniref:Tripartite tricarboxylate transporter substrate binding protein n=1 Tax=Halomonas llamarensis TaxID=2945104 RepID=A0ABT0SUU7_9GAMM|nr:tripartite tricarboxylate transporter substrate binding protein [Halomonas llamarensis]MCL7931531.1 tripartite tricarboxylate transporter substrate binding protein [Halomonas llamarensis]
MKTNLAVLLSAPFLLAATGAAQAQDYPTKTIQIVVPYSAGGGGDTVARIVADRLSEELDQTINVVNREGAGGEIGIDEIARSDADGYTLGVFGYPDNFVLEHTRDTNFTFDDLDYLAAFDEMPMGVFASPNSSHSTLEEVVNYGQENPGEMIIGESGALGLLHALAFAERSEMQVTPVRYSGGGELMNALLGDHIDLASTSSMSHDPIVDSDGKPIGFAAEERMDMFPSVPTFKEQGLDLVMGVSRVLVAPAGLPDDIRETIVVALDEISTDEKMIANFKNAAIPYRYLDDSAVDEMLEASNSVLMPVIEKNLDQIKGN